MDQSTVILLELSISTRTIRAILAEVHVRHNPVMRPVLHSLINYSASQLADALRNRPIGSSSTYLGSVGKATEENLHDSQDARPHLSQSPRCHDNPPDAVAAILQWAHQGIPILDYDYVKAWGESVVVEGARFSPTTDTLAAAALVFCQGEYDRHFDCHSMETQNEHEVTVAFGGMSYLTSPAVLCASLRKVGK